MYSTKCFRTIKLHNKYEICWAKGIETGIGGAHTFNWGGRG